MAEVTDRASDATKRTGSAWMWETQRNALRRNSTQLWSMGSGDFGDRSVKDELGTTAICGVVSESAEGGI
eukprot:254055-Amphidinium_carterae.1